MISSLDYVTKNNSNLVKCICIHQFAHPSTSGKILGWEFWELQYQRIMLRKADYGNKNYWLHESAFIQKKSSDILICESLSIKQLSISVIQYINVDSLHLLSSKGNSEYF